MQQSIVRLFCVVLGLFCATNAFAFSGYISTIPNGSDNRCMTCHVTSGGGGACASRPCLNPFGVSYRAANRQWGPTLAGQDSDNDGWSNGQELGDPFALWTPNTPAPNLAATLPGFDTSKPADFNLCAMTMWHDCAPIATCSDTYDGSGAWMCSCPAGYAGDGHLLSQDSTPVHEPPYSVVQNSGCQDMDECADTSTCAQDKGNTCVNNDGGFSCNCTTGFVLDGAGSTLTCKDVDECMDATLCGADMGYGACQNNEGGFDCQCAQGHKKIGSGNSVTCVPNDPCAANIDNCSSDAVCAPIAQAPGFSCTCNAGFMGDGVTCNDVDECQDTSTCSANTGAGTCTNNDGGYSCACNAGFDPTGAGNTQDCADVDECQDASTCSANMGAGTCVNMNGGYNCLCGAGYQQTGQGSTLSCADIDECQNNPCGAQSSACTNSQGSYTCQCNAGYDFDGTTCVVSNACTAGTDNCADDAACAPSAQAPGFSCTCNAGFMGDGVTCNDVDECQDTSTCKSNINVNNICSNTDGGFSCTCGEGFILAGTAQAPTCDDVDECANSPMICGKGTCANTEGSYDCTCEVGYVLSADGSTCVDKDECTDASACGANLDASNTCTNTDGGFDCKCGAGFALLNDGANTTCLDIDECVTDPCEANEVCTNNTGGFDCTCAQGFVLENGTCVMTMADMGMVDMGSDMDTDMGSDMADTDMSSADMAIKSDMSSDMGVDMKLDMNTNPPSAGEDDNCTCTAVDTPSKSPSSAWFAVFVLAIVGLRRRMKA